MSDEGTGLDAPDFRKKKNKSGFGAEVPGRENKFFQLHFRLLKYSILANKNTELKEK